MLSLTLAVSNLREANAIKEVASLLDINLNVYECNKLEPVSSFTLTTHRDMFNRLEPVGKGENVYGELKGNYMYIPSIKDGILDWYPDIKDKITFTLQRAKEYLISGKLNPIGSNTLCERTTDINYFINSDRVAVDIETYSLKHFKASIRSIALSDGEKYFSEFVDDDLQMRQQLKDFFKSFKGTLVFHNAAFDVTVLIYELFNKDYESVQEGLDTFLSNFHDTKLIAYLATNNARFNSLGLKELSYQFMGNYAKEDIKDILKIPKDELLEYNAKDVIATLKVLDKYLPILIQDDQQDIYVNLFKPVLRELIEMQLNGLYVYPDTVLEVRNSLEQISKDVLERLNNNELIKEFILKLKEDWVVKKNATLKRKRVTIDDASITFNPNSQQQKVQLIYQFLNCTCQFGCTVDSSTLEKISKVETNEANKTIIDLLLEFSKVDKILSTFIPALEDSYQSRIFGKQNLGGTVSGRLSSNDPNLANLPSGSTYGKLIKSCFGAPKGKLFIGIDMNQLEDRISALLTKDPNKLSVYTDGYDSHSLRAYAYFKEAMPDITERLSKGEDAVEVINSIKSLYPKLRSKAKAPTFALTYAGTYKTLVKNCNIPEDEAKAIEASYHQMYQVSDTYIKQRLDEAHKKGYVSLAFGLRLRCHILKHSILNSNNTPYAALTELRTVQNAFGQSYGMLVSRALVEFNNLVRNSVYRGRIKACNSIHDALYFEIDDDIAVLKYCNDTLVKCLSWQADPAIAHDLVHLGGELSVFFPSWKDEKSISNNVTWEQLNEIN